MKERDEVLSGKTYKVKKVEINEVEKARELHSWMGYTCGLNSAEKAKE